jgi:hypothetical protein
MVGVRYQRLQNAIAEIDEKIQTEETAKGTKESAKFLWAADVFICVVAFPYYITHNLPEALGKEFMQEHFKNDTSFSRTAYTIGAILMLREPLKKAFLRAGKALVNGVARSPTIRQLSTDIKKCSIDPQTVFALELLYDNLATKNRRPQLNASEQFTSGSDPRPT